MDVSLDWSSLGALINLNGLTKKGSDVDSQPSGGCVSLLSNEDDFAIRQGPSHMHADLYVDAASHARAVVHVHASTTRTPTLTRTPTPSGAPAEESDERGGK